MAASWRRRVRSTPSPRRVMTSVRTRVRSPSRMSSRVVLVPMSIAATITRPSPPSDEVAGRPNGRRGRRRRRGTRRSARGGTSHPRGYRPRRRWGEGPCARRAARRRVRSRSERGRRTGKAHRIEIWFVVDDGSAWLLTERSPETDWVANLRADPEVTLEIGDDSRSAARAEVVEIDRGNRVRVALAERYAPGDREL